LTAPFDRDSRGCRFIAGDPRDLSAIGEVIYCGRPVARVGEAWCAEHRAICYRAPEQRARAASAAAMQNAA